MTFFNCSTDFQFCPKGGDAAYFTSSYSLASQIVAISFLIFTCLAGNALLCYAVYKTSARFSASSIFILNLAVTDILVGTLVLPFWILSTATLSWPLSNAACEFTAFLTTTLMQCSIFSLCGIAADRYLNIRHPLRYPIEATFTRVSLVVLGIWCFCVSIASFPLFGWGDYRFQPQTVPICNPEYISEVSFTIFLCVFGMALPFAIMLFYYIRIIQIARCQIQKIHSLQRTLEKPRAPPKQFLSVEGHQATESKRSTKVSTSRTPLSTKFSRNVKAVRRVFIAVGVFFLCWGPYVILNFWSVNNEHIPVPYLADLLTTLLAFTNSSVNPIIFILLNKDLRNVIRKLGRRLLCCLSSSSSSAEHSDLVTYVVEKSEHRSRASSRPRSQQVTLTGRDLIHTEHTTENNISFHLADVESDEFRTEREKTLREQYDSRTAMLTLPGVV
ncbi:alpha-1A adrenergic receptor-like [Haliotis rufescens]|uniref:alpha-1A adrenergic receptor-like n=1 Tax=Haliotis rufescens TaxID=6454 RepID=UPI00201F0C82|nr:alpha-1A adrenergic receptor-like [Haliotis rufescens]